MKKRTIITTDKELYNKLNMLNFSSEVVIKNIAPRHINKILNNVNKYNKVIEIEKIGEYFLLKKESPINFNIYFRKKNS